MARLFGSKTMNIALVWCHLCPWPCLENVDIEDIDVKIAEHQMILTLWCQTTVPTAGCDWTLQTVALNLCLMQSVHLQMRTCFVSKEVFLCKCCPQVNFELFFWCGVNFALNANFVVLLYSFAFKSKLEFCNSSLSFQLKQTCKWCLTTVLLQCSIVKSGTSVVDLRVVSNRRTVKMDLSHTLIIS